MEASNKAPEPSGKAPDGVPRATAATGSAGSEALKKPGEVDPARGSTSPLMGISSEADPPAPHAGDGSDGPVETDVDEMVAVVSQRAVEISKNVATLASTAGVEAANVVNNLSETVSGFSTGFVSLFSVFDPTAEEAQAQARAVLESGAGPMQGGAASGPAGATRQQGSSHGSAGPQRRVASRAIDLQANFGLPPEESLLEGENRVAASAQGLHSFRPPPCTGAVRPRASLPLLKLLHCASLCCCGL